MNITIKDDNMRFGVRVGAIIYNEEKNKILLENPKENKYMFPGGGIETLEDSKTAIQRELQEELGQTVDLTLKYTVELFLNIPNKKYHEIGFYYLTKIQETSIPNNFHSLDGDSTFKWVEISKLNNYEILGKPIKDKIFNSEINNSNLEHIIYKEY